MNLQIPDQDSPPIPIEFSDDRVYARLIALSENTGQPVDELIRKGVRLALPDIECEVLGEQFVGGLQPRNHLSR